MDSDRIQENEIEEIKALGQSNRFHLQVKTSRSSSKNPEIKIFSLIGTSRTALRISNNIWNLTSRNHFGVSRNQNNSPNNLTNKNLKLTPKCKNSLKKSESAKSQSGKYFIQIERDHIYRPYSPDEEIKIEYKEVPIQKRNKYWQQKKLEQFKNSRSNFYCKSPTFKQKSCKKEKKLPSNIPVSPYSTLKNAKSNMEKNISETKVLNQLTSFEIIQSNLSLQNTRSSVYFKSKNHSPSTPKSPSNGLGF